MTTANDAALAQLSLAAYSEAPVALPAGFTPLDATSLPIALGAGESFAGGVYHNANAAALVTSAVIDGQNSLVLAFRGSDDQTDSLNDLQNMNADYPLFTSLIQAVDAAAASGAYQQVVVTGHSLGGALAQIYMATHPDQPGGVAHDAVTFGSPGALLPPGDDPRITNFMIADDPAPFLGAHRATIGDVLRADPALANLAADRAEDEFPGLTRDQALSTLGALTVNYENRGDIVLLPGDTADLSPAANVAGLARLDAEQHAPELYASAVAAAAATPEPELVVPEAPTDNADLTFLRSLYDSDSQNPQAGEAALRQILDTWAQDLRDDVAGGANDVFTTVRDGLADLGHDLNLI